MQKIDTVIKKEPTERELPMCSHNLCLQKCSKKEPKSVRQRQAEYRARKKALRQNLPKKEPKSVRQRQAEYRARKKALRQQLSKREPKSAKQRQAEYRARRKALKSGIALDCMLNTQSCQKAEERCSLEEECDDPLACLMEPEVQLDEDIEHNPLEPIVQLSVVEPEVQIDKDTDQSESSEVFNTLTDEADVAVSGLDSEDTSADNALHHSSQFKNVNSSLDPCVPIITEVASLSSPVPPIYPQKMTFLIISPLPQNLQGARLLQSQQIFNLQLNNAFNKTSSIISSREEGDKPLASLIGHPTDEILKKHISDIVSKRRGISTDGVIMKIYDMYPKFDLSYRKEFIKSTLRTILCESGESSSKKDGGGNSNNPDCSVTTTDVNHRSLSNSSIDNT